MQRELEPRPSSQVISFPHVYDRTLTRRAFWPLAAGWASAVATGLSTSPGGQAWGRLPAGKRPRIAAIFTVLRFRSHAYNILENFLGP